MKKVEKKKKISKKSSLKQVKKMTTSELLRIRLDDEKRLYAELELKYSNLQREFACLELKLIECDYKMKASQVEKIGNVVESHSKKIEDLSQARGEFVTSIKERLNLKNHWGFDPKTGLIKED